MLELMLMLDHQRWEACGGLIFRQDQNLALIPNMMYVIAGMTKGEGLRVFRKMIRDKTNPIFGYRYTTKPRLGPLN